MKDTKSDLYVNVKLESDINRSEAKVRDLLARFRHAKAREQGSKNKLRDLPFVPEISEELKYQGYLKSLRAPTDLRRAERKRGPQNED